MVAPATRGGVSYADARRKGPSSAGDAAVSSASPTPQIEAVTESDVMSVEAEQAPSQRNIDRALDEGLERGLQLVDLDCNQLESLSHDNIADFIDKKNAGRTESVPQFLLDALRGIEGTIESLVKVRYPANIKDGEKVLFRHNGMEIKVKAKGDRGGSTAILAVLLRKRHDFPGLAWRTALSAKRFSSSFKSTKAPKVPEVPRSNSYNGVESPGCDQVPEESRSISFNEATRSVGCN